MIGAIAKSAAASIAALALGALLASPAPAQTTAKDVEQKAAQTADAIRNYTVDKKNEAVAHAKKLTHDLDGDIKKLETKASKASGEAKVKGDKAMKDLKEKQKQAGKKLDELGKASGAAWDSAKHGFADAFKDLRVAYDQAASQFTK
jgi:hypothetical protein